MDKIRLINIVLVALTLVLLINLFYPITLITGSLIYTLDPSGPVCVFSYDNELNEIPIDECCYELQKQLKCEETEGKFDIQCYTSEKTKYLINKKTFNYCKIEGYDVSIK